MADKRPLQQQTLEQRIAACLSNNGDGVKTSAAVSDLIQEVNVAIAAADESVKQAKERSLDPSIPFDEDAVQRLATDEIRCARLHAACDPLSQRLSVVLAAEAAAAWDANYHRLEKLFDATSAKLASRYPAIVAELLEIFGEVQSVERQCDDLNGRAASGEMRRLRFSADAKSVIAATVLPDWNGSDAPLWPVVQHGSFAAAVFAAPPPWDESTSGDWWKASSEQRAIDAERQRLADEAAQVAKQEFYEGRP